MNQKPFVLIIDDNTDNIALVEEILAGFDFEFAATTDPHRVEEVFRFRKPDLVLLDLYMPEQDGLTTLDQIKSNPHSSDTPVIMLTAESDKHIMSECLSRGAMDYLTKPVDHIELEARIRSALKISGLTLQLKDANAELRNKNRMIRDQQAQIIQTERLASLGRMVAGIAHDFNNPLNVISGNLNWLKETGKDFIRTVNNPDESEKSRHLAEDLGEALGDGLESSIRAAQRMADIVGELKRFIKLDEAELKPVDLNTEIDVVLKRVGKKAEGIDFVLESGEQPAVTCYAAEINQILLNVLDNAVHAITEARAQPESATTGRIVIRTASGANDVRIEITDDGIGLDPGLQDLVFDPFFTTRDVGSGRGLGLSEAYGVVKKHGGQITFESQPGTGSTVIITLPLSPAAPSGHS